MYGNWEFPAEVKVRCEPIMNVYVSVCLCGACGVCLCGVCDVVWCTRMCAVRVFNVIKEELISNLAI